MRQVRPSKVKRCAWEHTASYGWASHQNPGLLDSCAVLLLPPSGWLCMKYKSFMWIIFLMWFLCQKNTFHFHHANHKSKASLVNVLARNLCPWWPQESLIPQISKKYVPAGPTTQVDSRRQGQQATQIWFLGAKKMKGAAPLVVCSAHKWLRLDHCHPPAYHKAQHPSPWRDDTSGGRSLEGLHVKILCWLSHLAPTSPQQSKPQPICWTSWNWQL